MIEVISSRKSFEIKSITIRSSLLQNPAGVADQRDVSVYIPNAKGKHPVLYYLTPWTQSGKQAFGWQAFKEPLDEKISRLISEKKIPPVVVVAPDLYTYFGGSQFIDSPFLGSHASFIVKELTAFIESNFPVAPGWHHRGVFGRSSGGFGGLRLAMDFEQAFASVACHSGDLGFDAAYRHDLLLLPQELSRFDNDCDRFIKYTKSAAKLRSTEVHVLMLLGMAASYSPNPEISCGFDLPIDLWTGEIKEDVWRRWLAHDPVCRLDQTWRNLTGLKRLFIDCGKKDQYNLHFGARQLSKKLKNLKVEHSYEEFDDNHSGTEYRFDASLPEIVGVLV
ncbi:MAG: alpha/beta hydrolase-fold protein [Oligoflexales bacterium]